MMFRLALHIDHLMDLSKKFPTNQRNYSFELGKILMR